MRMIYALAALLMVFGTQAANAYEVSCSSDPSGNGTFKFVFGKAPNAPENTGYSLKLIQINKGKSTETVLLRGLRCNFHSTQAAFGECATEGTPGMANYELRITDGMGYIGDKRAYDISFEQGLGGQYTSLGWISCKSKQSN